MRLSFWRKCRACLRWCGIGGLLLLLAAVCSFIWFNEIGLPDFLKTRLVQALHSRGIVLEFSRMRLRVIRGIVAENVRIGDAGNSGGPALTLAEIDLRLNYRALLLHRQFQVDGLVLHEGDMVWPVAPAKALALGCIESNVRFQTDDTWTLDNFSADFSGAQIMLSGEIAHAPDIRKWEIFNGKKSTNPPVQLQKILETLARIHFDGSPQLKLDVTGDAHAIHTFTIRVSVAQARTQLTLDGGVDDAGDNYHWHAAGTLGPEFIKPFLMGSKASKALDILHFNRPMVLDVNGGGRLHSLQDIGATGRIALTNFTVRGESFGDAESAVDYTNGALELLKPLTHTGAQMMSADSVTVDFNTRRIYFTNGLSTADPGTVVRAIGPKPALAVQPYHFLQPPTARVNGWLSYSDIADVDLNFEIIKGAPFQWKKLRTPEISGDIHWLGLSLVLTNVTSEFYGGNANGHAYFDFRPHDGATFDFLVNLTDVNLHWLAVDLSSPSNSLDGQLDGQLVVTSADTQNWQSWNGFGRARLRNGLIWDEPIFGFLSPMLNAVSPGLGSSRATDASAKFTLTNGVAATDSLEIRSTMARLQYVGIVDLKQRVDARVTVEPLRNLWLIGPVVGTLLTPVGKLFEYHVTGTLENPRSNPVYVPKFLLMPLHPIRTFEELFPSAADAKTPGN